MQRAIRTCPNGYIQQMETLNKYLSDGYKVVMCNKIDVFLEYIVEKKDNEEVEK